MKFDRKQTLALARLLAPIAKRHGVTLRALLAVAIDAVPELQKRPDLAALPEDLEDYLDLIGLLLDLA